MNHSISSTLQAEAPFVSIVIPAFNEERHVPISFAAIASQSYPLGRFEVILVDNGSTDRTAELAREFSDRIDLRIALKTGGSIADVRNHGASLAKGEVLAFLDCDCVVPEGWLQQGVAVGSPGLLWGAHYLAPRDARWVAKIWEEFQANPIEGPASFIPSSNLWMYKNSFERIGRFSNTQETSEDVELSQRARLHGLRVEAFPSLSVIHRGSPETLPRFFLQNRWHGKHVLRMFLRNLPHLTYLPLLTLSFYTLALTLACIPGAIMAVLYRRLSFIGVPVLLLLLPPFLLALVKALPRRRVAAFPQLFALYATYLIARAAALTQPPSRSHR